MPEDQHYVPPLRSRLLNHYGNRSRSYNPAISSLSLREMTQERIANFQRPFTIAPLLNLNNTNTPIQFTHYMNGHSSEQSTHSHSSNHLTSQQRSSRSHAPLEPLGSRQDVEQDDYESPIRLMFQRFYDRYMTEEQRRREVAATVALPGSAPHPTIHNPFDWNVGLQDATISLTSQPQYGIGQPNQPGFVASTSLPETSIPITEPYGIPNPLTHPAWGEIEDLTEDNAIDRQVQRPEPCTVEDMTINMACKVCLEQKIDTLIEPCMHLAMCRWCAEVFRANARALRSLDPIFRQPWRCPVCRKHIGQVRRVYI